MGTFSAHQGYATTGPTNRGAASAFRLMLASGIHYREADSLIEREDGAGLTIWIWLNDGGLATLFIPLAELERRAHQVSESQHVPEGMLLQ